MSDIEIHSNLKLLSHSATTILHQCPRKFQLHRLMFPFEEPGQTSVDLRFGTAVGNGIQKLFVTRDMNAAVMTAFMSWEGYLWDDAGNKSNKEFIDVLIALDRFHNLVQGAFKNYEVVIIDGVPASELGFVINFPDGFKYRGLLDLLLINKITGELVVLECKTTKYRNVNEAQYKNSAQGLAYALVTDAIAKQLAALGIQVKSSYIVMYPIYMTSAKDWEVFYFKKTNTNRANWLRLIMSDIDLITFYARNNYFPMYGESCFSFFRQCEYFEVCDFQLSSFTTKAIVDHDEEIAKYTFNFSLEDLIQASLAKYETERETHVAEVVRLSATFDPDTFSLDDL